MCDVISNPFVGGAREGFIIGARATHVACESDDFRRSSLDNGVSARYSAGLLAQSCNVLSRGRRGMDCRVLSLVDIPWRHRPIHLPIRAIYLGMRQPLFFESCLARVDVPPAAFPKMTIRGIFTILRHGGSGSNAATFTCV
jgi:hypothetical protein